MLDTHALIWALHDTPRLSGAVRDTISGSETLVFVSSVSAYEIAYKFRLGKLAFAEALARRFESEIAVPGFATLGIAPVHASRAGLLPIKHRDPFDRMLIAQAQVEQLTLISNEKLFDQFGVIRLW